MGDVHYLSVAMTYYADCCVCGVPIYGPTAHHKATKENHNKWFYCVNGHSQHWSGETDAARLERLLKAEREESSRRLESERKRREWAEKNARSARHSAAVSKGKLRAQSARVKNGVCPCCNRSFVQLQRHIATKHPDFAAAHED